MDNVAARRLLQQCFHEAVAAVDPELAVARKLSRIEGRVVVLALGKGAPAMARGAARALERDRLEGIVVSNHVDEVPAGMDLLVASHPVPDQSSLVAGAALLDTAASLGPDDTALVLVSGGGSALAVAPVDGLGLEDLAVTNEVLLRSGADIVAMNVVRRRLSRLKGGGLAAATRAGRLMTLAVSDVVGDAPEAIASGPTIDPGDPPDAALALVNSLGIAGELPERVLRILSGVRPPRLVPPPHEFQIVAGGADAAHAAAAAAERSGVPAAVVDTRMVGDAADMAGEALRRSRFGLSVFAGETTVDVMGDGVGGRNHEAALTAATLIAGQSGVWFLAAGTDGIDGTTDAAGAIVDGGTVARALAAGLNPDFSLDCNDSGTFFAELDERIVTGPTGTNVGDIWLVLRD